MSDDLILAFGDLLRRLRIEAGLKQRDIAERMHCHEATISRLETSPKLPRRDDAVAYLEALDLPLATMQQYLHLYDEMEQGKSLPQFEQIRERQQVIVIGSRAYLDVLQQAKEIAGQCGAKFVGTPHLFLALCEVDTRQRDHLQQTAKVNLLTIQERVSAILSCDYPALSPAQKFTLEALLVQHQAYEMVHGSETAVTCYPLWQALLCHENGLLSQLLERSGNSTVQLLANLQISSPSK